MIFKYFLTTGRYIPITYGILFNILIFSSVFSLRTKKILDTKYSYFLGVILKGDDDCLQRLTERTFLRGAITGDDGSDLTIRIRF